jgi:hypothetical protein
MHLEIVFKIFHPLFCCNFTDKEVGDADCDIDMPYYMTKRERDRFLLKIGERATKVQGCNVTRQQHPKNTFS